MLRPFRITSQDGRGASSSSLNSASPRDPPAAHELLVGFERRLRTFRTWSHQDIPGFDGIDRATTVVRSGSFPGVAPAHRTILTGARVGHQSCPRWSAGG